MSEPTTDTPGLTEEQLAEAAFALPASVAADPTLAALHEQWVLQLRAESSGLPMHTVQQFLLERIASMYVIIRHHELHPLDGGWTPRLMKDYVDQWLGMVKEWNRVLASGQEQLREQVLREAEQISLEALKLVPDDETRRVLRLHFAERYAAIGF